MQYTVHGLKLINLDKWAQLPLHYALVYARAYNSGEHKMLLLVSVCGSYLSANFSIPFVKVASMKQKQPVQRVPLGRIYERR